jgi:hypothetical protein
MADPHVISALKLKRAEISGHIQDLERRAERYRASLANIDATILLFAPGSNPDAIPPKKPYRRSRYFRQHELPRLVLDALRLASAPLATVEIVAAVMRVKRLPQNDPALRENVAERVLNVLRPLCKRGEVVKTGVSRDARWAIAPELL